MPDIKIKNINKTYTDASGAPVEAIKDINIDIKDGEFVSIVGPSGCGKSTLLEIVAGLLEQTSGEVIVGDDTVKGTSRDIGVVFQDSALFPWKTVKKNILYGLELSKVPREEQEEKLKNYLELMNLTGFEDKYPSQLSGGMRQRAGIARTLIMDPKVTLMDEPFSAVDHLTRCTLQEELVRIHEKEKKTVLFITHDISEAVFLSDRVILLSPRPSVVQNEYKINVKHPRSRSDDYLVQITARIVADINRGAAAPENDYII
ncbi:MAG: ABC transporter ATP-binding protein [Lachnospiraceae bacterium]|nr:ABC transporter ATP-binding protein [Lachnospiraceae bacterium]